MTAAEPGTGTEPPRLPAAVRWGLVPLASLLLFLLFSLALFPYERFREPVARRLGEATGAQVEIASLEGGLGWAGPHVVARTVAFRFSDGATLALERTRIRPAWSLSWLRGSPALRIGAEGAVGRAELTLWPGPPLAVEGKLRALEVGRLPLGAFAGKFPIEGTLDAELALTNGSGGPRGHVRFRAREGSLALPTLPVAVPYEMLRGSLSRGADGATEVESLELEGPLLSASATGRVGAASRLAAAPLDLEVEIASVDSQLAPALRRFGVSPDGGGRLAVRGTLGDPRVRSR